MANLISRHLLPMVFATLVMVATPVHGGPLAAPDAQQVRRVIFDQFDALATDDAQRLFETTTPAVRQAFGSSGDFMAMVRTEYPMVYRPRTVGFHPPERVNRGVLQLVELTDSQEQRWLALFSLEQQPDNSWRISGCVVMHNPWLQA